MSMKGNPVAVTVVDDGVDAIGCHFYNLRVSVSYEDAHLIHIQCDLCRIMPDPQ